MTPLTVWQKETSRPPVSLFVGRILRGPHATLCPHVTLILSWQFKDVFFVLFLKNVSKFEQMFQEG